MTKSEAIQAMEEGKKVRHRYFSDNEWVKELNPFMYIYEDGVRHSKKGFWDIREQNDGWDEDWEIVQ